jgi:hypothetical protein
MPVTGQLSEKRARHTLNEERHGSMFHDRVMTLTDDVGQIVSVTSRLRVRPVKALVTDAPGSLSERVTGRRTLPLNGGVIPVRLSENVRAHSGCGKKLNEHDLSPCEGRANY